METNYDKVIKAFESMDADEKHATLVSLLSSGTIDIAKAIAAYSCHLEKFKRDAQYDIGRLGTAGLDLAEKQIKAIPKMKNKRKRDVATAQALTLLSTRAYHGTPFENELLESINTDDIDKEWFSRSWQLRTVLTPELSSKEKENLCATR